MDTFSRRYCRSKSAVFGLVGLSLIILIAILSPWIAPFDPWQIGGLPFTPPFKDVNHILGTDLLGRDILSGILYGARVSLLVGILSVAATVMIGVLLGALAGYFGGRVDDLLMRFTEFFQVLPSFVFAIVLVSILRPSIRSIIIAIVIISWPPVARLVRGEFLSLKTREFVQAAVSVGHGPARIIFREILPNAINPVVAIATLMIASAIILESSISFLGLGDPNLITWGYMIGASRSVIRLAWWMSVFPGCALVLTVLAINSVGEGLSRSWDPRAQINRGG
jgi:peptide/nickel transport system permease protein